MTHPRADSLHSSCFLQKLTISAAILAHFLGVLQVAAMSSQKDGEFVRQISLDDERPWDTETARSDSKFGTGQDEADMSRLGQRQQLNVWTFDAFSMRGCR